MMIVDSGLLFWATLYSCRSSNLTGRASSAEPRFSRDYRRGQLHDMNDRQGARKSLYVNDAYIDVVHV